MAYFLRRAVARLIDYLLWGMLTAAVLGDKTGDFYAPSRLFYASFWVYLFVEVALISSFGTTAGKKLMGIYVVGSDGEKLSLSRSFKRSLLVFGGGLGFLLPYASLILPVCAAFWMLKRHELPWDKVVPDRVDIVNITRLNKILLAVFFLFMAAGYFMTIRIAFLYRSPDFASLEDKILAPYFETIHPQLVDVLSEDAVLTPENAEKTAAALQDIQQQMQYQEEELLLLKDAWLTRLEKIPDGEWKTVRRMQADAFFEKMNGFLFAESMRIGLFENILEFFKSADKNKYEIVDGRPVFADAELARQYDNYMAQLQIFLSLGIPDPASD